MSATLSSDEASLALQTIEMFEVVTQSNPADFESLEILKEAYLKLSRQNDVLRTSKRIAHAYALSGKLSSAILEYESVLQLFPDDPDAQKALADIENQATPFASAPPPPEIRAAKRTTTLTEEAERVQDSPRSEDIDDGRAAMEKLLVEGKQISAADFNLYWNTPNPKDPPKQAIEPFLQVLADKQLLPLDKSLKLICEKSRLGFLMLEKYDVDIEFARTFPRESCLRWSVLPFDRMSKSVLVATANPFNQRAAWELENFNAQMGGKHRFLWYIASPTELLKILKKVFR